jgi:lysophospholipase L1-like esterase
MGLHRSTRFATALAVAALAAAGLTSCQKAPDTYVALGDSYTAGPLIPLQSLQPLGCLRSDHNYPSLVAPTIGVPKARDVSCSGATTTHMSAPQGVTPGPNPPQLNALDASTKVVTLGIGGNDIGFSSIVQGCAVQNPFGSGCAAGYQSGGHDQVADKIAATAPKVDAVLQAIKARAPQAKVLVIGYPTILPDSGNGCYPLVPILAKDVPYLRAKEKQLNAMLAAQAAANGATYVDTYTSSIGHDVCRAPGTKWVEGVVPTSTAAPVHPNADGMRHTAGLVTAAILALP